VEAEEQIVGLERRAQATHGQWSRVVAARARALLADESGFDAAFAVASRGPSGAGLEFERFRTEWCWAERLVEVRRAPEAIAHLRIAACGFEGKGAAM